MASQFDVVLRNGWVIDGSGDARERADVGIAGDRIAAIDRIAAGRGALEVDLAGKVAAPGFIDVHTHDDRALLVTPDMAAKVSQGVTTVITGNCGISLAPLITDHEPPPPLDLIGTREWYRFGRFGQYLDALDQAPPAINAACLVGHSTLRVGNMDDLTRPATEAERAAMRAQLLDALDDGAIGLSSGTYYDPAAAAPTDEVAALAEPVGAAGGIYATHMRDEGDHVMESLEETFEIGRRATSRW